VGRKSASLSPSAPFPLQRDEEKQSGNKGVESLDKQQGVRGGVVLINADGFCAFHLAGVVGQLCPFSQVLCNDQAPCTVAVLESTREQILVNFNKWRDGLRSWFPSNADLEEQVFNVLGQSSEEFQAHVAGLIPGEGRLGTFQDLALYTFSLDVRVVVVHADMIKADSSDEALTLACFPRPSDVTNEALAGERGKRRVVCAVLSKAHYDLGVVFGSEIEASFGVGVEWDRARGLILNYLREIKKSPKPKVFWTPSDLSVQPLAVCTLC
jgi:hypothetical protein